MSPMEATSLKTLWVCDKRSVPWGVTVAHLAFSVRT